MLNVELGQKVRAKADRCLVFEDGEPLVIWKKGYVYRVEGIFQCAPGQTPDVVIDLGNGNSETIPVNALPEYFEPAEVH